MIPTAEEFFLDIFNKTECFIDYDKSGLNCIKQAMNEFAKLSIKEALKKVSNNKKDIEE